MLAFARGTGFGLGLLALLLAGPGRAAQPPVVLVPVSGQFREPLVVVPPQLDLGVLQGGAGLQSQTFKLRLPAGQPFRLGLDAGQNSAAQQRRLVHNSDSSAFLPYELYQDAAGQQPWSDGQGAVPGTPLTGVGTGGEQAIPVWARLPQMPRGRATTTTS